MSPRRKGPILVRFAQDHSSDRVALQVTAPARTGGTISVVVPRSGAVVTVHAEHNRHPSRSFGTGSGTTSLSVRVTGGATYDIEVTPR
jgi:hypothetical protein